ncbi:hypothetical protein [Mesorhizobium dulcispinae]|uniref:hypothetical protein n=1 Tax=Mesorhizobium dulcispinae TaxID=3072316 RepID=UPI002A240744|nr:hypothetical protein [Mesorhizobium sp. VK23D]MDX8522749.1 hypothetical protein [Mesorhizobium sp. VK23D]
MWLFREHLPQARAVENLFARFDKHPSISTTKSEPIAAQQAVPNLTAALPVCEMPVVRGVQVALSGHAHSVLNAVDRNYV